MMSYPANDHHRGIASDEGYHFVAMTRPASFRNVSCPAATRLTGHARMREDADVAYRLVAGRRRPAAFRRPPIEATAALRRSPDGDHGTSPTRPPAIMYTGMAPASRLHCEVASSLWRI